MSLLTMRSFDPSTPISWLFVDFSEKKKDQSNQMSANRTRQSRPSGEKDFEVHCNVSVNRGWRLVHRAAEAAQLSKIVLYRL